MKGAGAILFYDGHCALCNAWVRRLLRWDRTGVLKFAPLQGVTASTALEERLRINPQTVVLLRDGEVFEKSEAVLESLAALRKGGLSGRLISVLARTLRYVPRRLRDAVYDGVAKYRFRIWGRYDSCPVPPVEVRGRFLP